MIYNMHYNVLRPKMSTIRPNEKWQTIARRHDNFSPNAMKIDGKHFDAWVFEFISFICYFRPQKPSAISKFYNRNVFACIMYIWILKILISYWLPIPHDKRCVCAFVSFAFKQNPNIIVHVYLALTKSIAKYISNGKQFNDIERMKDWMKEHKKTWTSISMGKNVQAKCYHI